MTGKQFIYENIRIDEARKVVEFDYIIETDEKKFTLTETIKLPIAMPVSDVVDRLLITLHIALGISYYKTFIPPVIEHGYEMEQKEADFWNNVFKNGLGEFLYKNKLKSTDLAIFTAQPGDIKPGLANDIEFEEKALLGIGGGKDSIVAGEILKEIGVPVSGFVLATGENKGQAQAVADVMGVGLLSVERSLDKQILAMNKLDGAYNGHVPISLVFALIGSLLAICEGARYVIVANEASASIPHVSYEGSEVNHQWSKSLEFEKQFNSYLQSFISPQLEYTSIVRPLTSIAIAKLFTNYPKYFETFTSDNSVFKIVQKERSHPRWSLDSPKSLSSYILLAPWMSDEQLQLTFGTNFLDDSSLDNMFLNLLGYGDKPVLDCVGTPDELRLSLSMLAGQNRFTESALVKVANDKNLLMKVYEGPLEAGLALADDYSLPAKIEQKIIDRLKEKLI